MKVLNLYAGLGGNRKLWQGCEVTAVEKNEEIAEAYILNNPNDKIIIGDAHKYLLENFKDFDFIWSSPPCQSHSKMMKFTRHDVIKYPDLKLYEEIILLNNFFKGKFVVENVKPYYTPLIKPTAEINRHFFWSNFFIPGMQIDSPKDFIDGKGRDYIDRLKNWLGLEYNKYIYYGGGHDPARVLRNCIHPKIGLHIFERAKRAKSKIKTKDNKNNQLTLNIN